MSFLNNLKFDKIIHEKSRLLILSSLAVSENEFTTFWELKEKLGFTSGNLSVQLKKLEDSDYILIDKEIVQNKSLSKIKITKKGLDNLNNYLEEMQSIMLKLGGKND